MRILRPYTRGVVCSRTGRRVRVFIPARVPPPRSGPRAGDRTAGESRRTGQDGMAHYLLFATELYALPVLRPIDAAIRAMGGEAAWFAPATFKEHLHGPERLLPDIASVG